MAHDDRERICMSLSSGSGFKELKVNNLSCNEHSSCSLPVLDQHEYNQ